MSRCKSMNALRNSHLGLNIHINALQKGQKGRGCAPELHRTAPSAFQNKPFLSFWSTSTQNLHPPLPVYLSAFKTLEKKTTLLHSSHYLNAALHCVPPGNACMANKGGHHCSYTFSNVLSRVTLQKLTQWGFFPNSMKDDVFYWLPFASAYLSQLLNAAVGQLGMLLTTQLGLSIS